MKNVIVTGVLVVGLLLPCPAALAGFSGTDVFLPSIGRAQGIANWYTTMWVHNPSPLPVHAEFYLLRRNVANTGAVPVRVLIPGGATLRYANAVGELFAEEAFGAIRVVSSDRLVVTSRIYSRATTDPDSVSKGQVLAGIPASFAVGAEGRTRLLGVYQTQPSADSDFRYNFGFVETTGFGCTVRVVVLDARGTPASTPRSYPLRGFEQQQFQFKNEFPDVSGDNFALDVEVVAGTGRIIAFGSGVANRSDDPSTFEMQFADSLLEPGSGGSSTVIHDGTLRGDGTQTAPLGLAPGGVTGETIADGQIVRSINGLKDGVSLVAGSNVTITPAVGTLTISATPGGGGGDITAVIAGAGLTGGATSGDATLAVAAGGISGVMLAPGAAVKTLNGFSDTVSLVAGSNVTITPAAGTLTISATPGGGGGDITAVIAGAGLTGGATSGDATLAVAAGGISGVMLAANSVDSGKIVDSSVQAADVAFNYAGSGSKGGAATDLACSGCVDGATEIAAATVPSTRLSGAGATNGQVLKFNGAAVAWAADETGGLTLPWAGSGASATQLFAVTNTGSGAAVRADTGSGTAVYGVSPSGIGAYGESTTGFGIVGSSSANIGVKGVSTSAQGVRGDSSSSDGVYGVSVTGYGVKGVSSPSPYATGAGVYGSARWGVWGTTSADNGSGVVGEATGTGSGVKGVSASGTGTIGQSTNGYGVEAYSSTSDAVFAMHSPNGNLGRLGTSTEGVFATSNNGNGLTARSASSDAVHATNVSSGNYGSVGTPSNGVYGSSSSGYGVFGISSTGYAGYFMGRATVTGTLSKGGGSFKIDHPLDPERKYLYHSFVESPDMMNVYNGNVTTDANGEATIRLPDYFEALNRDYRYQLTAIGAPGPNLHVAEEIVDGRFKIAGATPGAKVSWQVTGIRKDPFANANRIPVEEDKPADEQGSYLHPDAWGQPEERGVLWARDPEMMRRMAQERAALPPPVPPR